MRDWLKKNLSSIMLVLIFLIGLSLLLYPSFSDYWNSKHQSRAIAGYTEKVTEIDDNSYDLMIRATRDYNTQLGKGTSRWTPSEEETDYYNSLLNVGGTGIMGSNPSDRKRRSLQMPDGNLQNRFINTMINWQ